MNGSNLKFGCSPGPSGGALALLSSAPDNASNTNIMITTTITMSKILRTRLTLSLFLLCSCVGMSTWIIYYF
jgi:hypothetical protein